MTNYNATIKHHSIAQARVIDTGTTNLTTAKRIATREFGGGYIGHEICIIIEPTPNNPSGVVASRVIGEDRWINFDSNGYRV